MQPKVLLVVSATVADAPTDGPRKDYRVLAETLEADVLDYASVQASGPARLLARLLGRPLAQAWLAFWKRDRVAAILTDGEHIGIPLAVLLKLARASTPHVTIGHRITAPKKRTFFRWLRVQTHIGRIVVHARSQYELGRSALGIEPEKLALVPYQVDTEFWTAQPTREEQLVSAVGLECRDYPTLMAAVKGLDVQLVIAAASHWSKRRNTAEGVGVPPNVRVAAFDYHALRTLYARSALVVVPLEDIDFQAGITTILEAMSMGKAVVVTRTTGQTDVVEDRRSTMRGIGGEDRSQAGSLLRELADRAGFSLEPNGFYVPPADPEALRRAIAYLLEHPEERARLGAAGRDAVDRLMTVDQYASRLAELVDAAVRERQPTPRDVRHALSASSGGD